MTPNNNLSVLPWYSSIEQQNARKWWIYGREYPLFTPAGCLLPFQILRPHTLAPADELDVTLYDLGYIDAGGDWQQDVGNGYGVTEYDVEDNVVFLANLPTPYADGVNAAAYDSSNVFLGSFVALEHDYYIKWELPAGTAKIRVQTYNSQEPDKDGKAYAAQLAQPGHLELYKKNGEFVAEVLNEAIANGLVVVPFPQLGYDVIVYPSVLPLLQGQENGQYYAVLNDGVNNWYSDVFTVVNDIEPYLKITWWDVENFVMDAGTIVYSNPSFKNVLYLPSSIAKPEYTFEEEGETRDGYFFPAKQISEKRYRFNFLASEYLLDVMRFIRMADFAEIEYHGQRYSLDTFLITPEWEDNGDVAVVEAEFNTATVAKKIGVGYIKAQRGDFNDDFNNDYNNQ